MDLLSIFVFIGIFLCGIATTLVVLKLVEVKALSIARQQAQAKGAIAKTEQSERLMSFLTDVKMSFDEAKASGKDINQFAKEDLPAIALKYPDVIMKFGSRLQKLLKDGNGEFNLDSLLRA